MAKKISDTFGEKIGMSRRDIYRLLHGGVSVEQYRALDSIDKKAFLGVVDRNSLWPKMKFENYGGQDSEEREKWLCGFLVDYCIRSGIPSKFLSIRRKALAQMLTPDGYVERIIATRDMVREFCGNVSAAAFEAFYRKVEDLWDLTGDGPSSYYYGDIAVSIRNSCRSFGTCIENARIANFPEWNNMAIFRPGLRLERTLDNLFRIRYMPANCRSYISREFDELEDLQSFIDRTFARSKSERSIEQPVRPMLKNLERTGPNRDASGILPERFQKRFGFRGGEFGTWLSDEDRRQSLVWAAQSFADLAAVLRIDEESIGGGALGFAFGARGKGGKNPAAAHYEPVLNVINLTKYAGAGSTAHEWGHFMDYHLLRPKGMGSDTSFLRWLEERDAKTESEKLMLLRESMDKCERYLMTWFSSKDASQFRDKFDNSTTIESYATALRDAASKVRKPVQARKFMNYIGHYTDPLILESFFRGHGVKLDFYKNARLLDENRGKPYWSTRQELFARAFEKYVHDQMIAHGMRNNYLVSLYKHDIPLYPEGKEADALNHCMANAIRHAVEITKPEPEVFISPERRIADSADQLRQSVQSEKREDPGNPEHSEKPDAVASLKRSKRAASVQLSLF